MLPESGLKSDGAWIRKPAKAEAVVEPSENNRPIAFPYTKLQVANSSVNQGAAFIVTSLAEARRRGIPDERLVHIGYGAAAHESGNFLARDRYDYSPSLATSIERAMALNEIGTNDLAHVELYSCFPCVPKMARRVLDWPIEKPVTVFGGLTFGGGPIGNYMSHAVVAMAEKLRGTDGRGLLFANGGYATHNHTIMLSGEPTGALFPQDFDYQTEADDRRGEVPPIDEDYAGPAVIETYTVHYDRAGSPKSGVIVALTPNGSRTLANVPADDSETIAFLTDGRCEPVGTSGKIQRARDSVAIWQQS